MTNLRTGPAPRCFKKHLDTWREEDKDPDLNIWNEAKTAGGMREMMKLYLSEGQEKDHGSG